MSGFFDKVKSGAGKVAFEADKAADAKKVQFDIGGLKKQIEQQYTKIGEMTYKRYAATGQETPEFVEACQGVVAIEQKIAAKEEELRQINARVWQAPAAAPAQQSYSPPPSYSAPPQAQQYTPPPPPPPAAGGQKFCPNCGAPAGDAKFCSSCGSKIA
jgi:hypothetical protein